VNQGATIIVTWPAILGTTSATLTSIPGSAVSIQLLTRSCSAGTGGWSAGPTLGTASITLTTATTATVVGSFTGTVAPQAGSGAVGDKTITGTFTATY
jgi:hypothetical protein